MFGVCGGIKALVSVNGTPAAEFGGSEVVKEMKVYGFGGVGGLLMSGCRAGSLGTPGSRRHFQRKERQKRRIRE